MKTIGLGALVWLAMWVVPFDPNLGMGTIEKLFLLAPLVVVPLGLNLVGALGQHALPAALLVVVSFLVPQRKLAGVLVLPWFGLVAWWAVGALRRWRWEPAEVCRNMAVMMLPVGAVGLAQSRAGMEPLGFREPLVLLVAVHFHFAAFVTPLMASEGMGRMKDDFRRMKWGLAALVCLGSPVLACGYVLHTGWLRLTGAMMLVVGLVIVSGLIAKELPKIRPRAAQALLAVAALSVWYSMAYAAVYAVADYCGEVWVAIPQMARTHGVVNALGFSVCGLLGWRMVVFHDGQGQNQRGNG